MALNLNRQQVEEAASIHGVSSLRENVAEGEFSEEDARAILSAKGFDLSFPNITEYFQKHLKKNDFQNFGKCFLK